MRAEGQADMFREEPGNLVRLIKRWQEQSRKLRHDVIHDAHTGDKSSDRRFSGAPVSSAMASRVFRGKK